jgi:hypothetical protein
VASLARLASRTRASLASRDMSIEVAFDVVVAVTVKTGVWGTGDAFRCGRTCAGVVFSSFATSRTTASPCTERL